MTKEQEEAIEYFENKIKDVKPEYIETYVDGKLIRSETISLKMRFDKEDADKMETVLNMLKEKDRQIDLIKEYAHQEIEHYTETIEDYMDDDKEGNKNYIKELKEKREHWKDIERILKNKPEELYMNWWKYGLYE